MSEEHENDMSGVAFKTEKEFLEKNPKLPVMTAVLNVAGIQLKLAFWKCKSRKTGKPMLSISGEYPEIEDRRLVAVLDKEARKEAIEAEQKEQEPEIDDDDLPF